MLPKLPSQPTTDLAPVNTLVETNSDRHAVGIWLRSYSKRSSHTQRNYKREADRFLMWLEVSKGQSDSHLPRVTTEDVNNYLDFLAAPRSVPSSVLIRYGRKEQPFKKPLANSSIYQSIVILHRMFDALRDLRGADGYGYIQINPWNLAISLSKQPIDDAIEADKSLTFDEWDEVLKTISLLPKETARELKHYHRVRWVFQLLYRTWYRRENIAKLRMNSFEQTKNGWFIRQIVKGGRKSKIVASEKLIDELKLYRLSLGLTPLPSVGEDRPAVMRVTGINQPIQPNVVYKIAKQIFNLTADRLGETQPELVDRFTAASTHWMRHTGVTHALNLKVDRRFVQAQANHKNAQTTARYEHHNEEVFYQNEINKI